MLIDGIYYSDPELISYIKKLKNTIAMNEESQKIADGVIEQLKQENAELKAEFEEFKNATIPYIDINKKNHKINELTKYLKLALDDIKIREKHQNNCFYCAYKAGCEGFFCCFKYKHEDEIKMLIGE